MKSMLSKSKQHIGANMGYYAVTILLILGIAGIGLSVLNQGTLSKYTKFKKKGGYSQLATDERYVDYDSDEEGDCEMKSLIQSDSYKKKSKKTKKKEEKGEELSLFDEVLEENKNYFGEYVDEELSLFDEVLEENKNYFG